MKKRAYIKLLIVLYILVAALLHHGSAYAASYNDVYNFDYTTGYQSSGFLLKASNGLMYGLTSGGGANGLGVIFKFDPSTNVETKVYDFDGTNGSNPYGSLMQASDGNLYGMTYQGGTNNMGVIFKFNPVSDVFTKLYDLSTANGANPFGALIQGSDSKLYGLTYFGGANNLGAIFSFNLTGNIYTKLYDFTSLSGVNPHGSLLLASNGLMYGVTAYGGANGLGVVFKFNPTGNVYTDIYDLGSGLSGSSGFGTLMQANDGMLYGLTHDGGVNNLGIIFKVDPSNDTFTKIFDFDSTNGSNPYGTLMQATDGNLYGNTYQGGTTNEGTLFKINPLTNAFTLLKSLTASTGRWPYEKLTEGSGGLLYGLGFDGGTSSSGVIYSYNTIPQAPDAPTNLVAGAISNSSVYITWNIPADNNGSTITGYKVERHSSIDNNFTTITDTVSNNYFTDTSAVLYSQYTYRVSAINALGASVPSNEAKIIVANYSNMFSFDNNTGANPLSSFINIGNGIYYGLTSGGGANGYGTIVRYDSNTNIATSVYSFTPSDSTPSGSLYYNNSNNMIYGVTTSGGANSYGMIFQLNPDNNIFTDVYDFDLAGGSNPYGPVTGGNGLLYGVTMNGGANGYGSIFSFNPSGNAFTKLYDFSYPTGGAPQSSPLVTQGNMLYGAATSGGAAGYGALYSYNLNNNTYTDLYDFQGPEGQYPSSALIDGQDGYLYGQATSGGTSNAGVLFKFKIANNTYTKIYDFSVADGNIYGSLVRGSDGLLYGVTNNGGIYSYGEVFRFSAGDNSFIKIHDFDNTNGSYPINTLYQASDGSLYGLTSGGGTNNLGVIFKIIPNAPQPPVHIYNNGGGLLAYLESHPPVVQKVNIPTPPTKELLTDKLFWGSKGAQVTLLQTILRNIKYFTGVIDGRFGRKTYTSVRAFQKANKLKTDGVVGAKTRALLNK